MAPAKDKVPDIHEGLCMLSPESYAHALLLACARDLPKNKEHWGTVLKSVPVCFKTVPNAEKDMWLEYFLTCIATMVCFVFSHFVMQCFIFLKQHVSSREGKSCSCHFRAHKMTHLTPRNEAHWLLLDLLFQ